jgi:hypothetical protein
LGPADSITRGFSWRVTILARLPASSSFKIFLDLKFRRKQEPFKPDFMTSAQECFPLHKI